MHAHVIVSVMENVLQTVCSHVSAKALEDESKQVLG